MPLRLSDAHTPRIGLLHEIATLSGLSLDEQLPRVLSRTAKLLDLDMGIFSWIQGETYTVEAVYDQSQSVSPGDTFTLSETPCALTVDAGEVIRIDAMGQSEYATHPSYACLGLEAYIGAPVEVDGGFYGTLCFTSAEPRDEPFTEDDADLVRLLASWMGMAVERMGTVEAARSSERQLAGVLDAAPMAVVLTGLDRVIQYVNPAFEQLYGWSRDEVVGRPTSTFYAHPEDYEHQGQVRYRAGASLDRDPYVIEYRRADGTTFLGETVGGPVVVEGEATTMLGFVHDVTKREAAREREAAAAAARADALRAKERFLANMSHEMRTPLNAVLGLSHLLSESPLSADQAGLLDGVRTAAATMLSLVDDLLELARLGARQLPIEAVPYAPAPVVAEVRQMVRTQAEEQGLSLQFDVADDVPETIVGDPTRLRQVLLNLVSNAVKFTECGGVRVRVTAAPEPAAAETVRLRLQITDTGVGIPADRQAAIFDPFVQATDDATRRFGGTGLGLAIAKELVERQGGQISVESVEGQGSTFTVELPAALPATAALAAAGAAAADAPSDLSGLRVLVVEDNDTNRFVARRVLEGWGVIVSEARDGREGVRAVASDDDLDLVLMDLQMPEMDGVAATRYIREVLGVDAETLPVIALTASVLASQHEDVLSAGLDDFLLKPFDPAELRERLAALTGRTAPPPSPDEPDPAPAIDPEEMARYTNDDPTFATQIAGLFLVDARQTADAIAQAVAAGDYDDAGANAHTLKGQAGYVGAAALSAAAHRLSEAARSGDRVAVASEAPVVARHYRAAAEELARLYPSSALSSSPTATA